MNPNDLFLRSHARAESSQQPQHTHNTRGQASASNGAPSSGVDQKPLDAQMMLDEAGAGAAEAGEGQKSRRELEQERKDLELAQLLEMMDDYKPVIPDEVTDYYLQRAGFDTNDVRVKRLLALSAQRFVSSISADAFQYARARTAAGPSGRANVTGTSAAVGPGATGATGGSGGAAGQPKAKGRQRTVLTMEDLSAALKEYGVDAGRAPYYL
ncbi:hypothetical protein NBRC10512_003900 [Rhodotorula toruloides]|uniref:Transcription initiation factor TFIID subunit 10 n=2 Tax=Rhodotorula toruloides TaxID=5286 RepID=A0A061AVZ1_RHOTO|nr:transcription initiation factor TFIID subunit 10 [Rhodotorula toruloides NP11]EMS21137.1 transcription initiation factor TFIID subunit 10 [Rhodotorula toruloides NP11]CDR39506.1 RHTO0S04e05842g1_1 [Rhodotorula toruloides]